mgnify:FL=1
MNEVYRKVLKFKQKYPMTVAWRLKKNSSVVERHLGKDEKVLYAFAAQKNDNPFDIFGTCVVALTSKRILIGRKRVVFGYFFDSITPDLFNDLKIRGGIIWGRVFIDTVKEFIALSNISNDALPEIENMISSYMIEAKKEYRNNDENDE